MEHPLELNFLFEERMDIRKKFSPKINNITLISVLYERPMIDYM